MKRLMNDDDYQYEGGNRRLSNLKSQNQSNGKDNNNNPNKKPMTSKNKVILNEDQEKWKKKILFGSRGLTRIFDSATLNTNQNRN